MFFILAVMCALIGQTMLLNAAPNSVYSTFLGGNGYETALDAATDRAGNVYVVGTTNSTNFPKTLGGGLNGAASDVFVTKLDPSGAVVYSILLGGSNNDQARAVAVDQAGSVYVAGFTDSANFPVTSGAAQTVFGGQTDAFLVKLNSSGAVVYATFLGGSLRDYAYGAAVDQSGNAYLTGYTEFSNTALPNFPVTNGAAQTVRGGGTYDAFLTKFNPAGAARVFSTLHGGAGNDFGRSVEVDSDGSAYITGATDSVNFPITVGAAQITNGGGTDAFVTKFAQNGASRTYSSYFGGNGYDYGYSIALDTARNAHIAGATGSTNLPTANAAQAVYGGGAADGFAAKLNATGAALVYASYLGGAQEDEARGVAINALGQANVTGYTYSANFPIAGGAVQPTKAFGGDAFIVRFNNPAPAAALAPMYSSFHGGDNPFAYEMDTGEAIAVDRANRIIVVGMTSAENFPTTTQAFDRGFNDFVDGFATKFNTFQTTAALVSVGGTIKFRNEAAAAGVTVSLIGDAVSRTVTTDEKGRFVFENVEAGKSYVIVPQHKLYIFNPENLVTTVNGAVDDLNFTAARRRKSYFQTEKSSTLKR